MGSISVTEEKNSQVDVLGIGDALVDLTTFVPCLPPHGGNVWGTAAHMRPGGSTANVTANLATLGMRSAFAGCVGADPYGQYIVEAFGQVGVDTSDVIVDSEAFTGIVLAVIDTSGERTFIACAKGAAHAHLLPEHIRQMDFSRTRAIHTSGVCLVEEPARSAILEALAKAKRAGIPIYYDPNLRLEGDVFPQELYDAQWKAIALADTILVGEGELRLLCNPGDLQTMADQVLAEGPALVIVKRGEKGAVAFKEGIAAMHQPAFDVEVTDTTGAGDAFDAGFIAGAIRGLDVPASLVYASAAAAIKVTRIGAKSVPTHEELIAFAEQQG
jgi:sugar/nucleoside kinase (ribokinase family)